MLSSELRNKPYPEFDAFCRTYCFNASTWNFSECSEINFVDCAMYPKTIIEFGYLVPATVVLVLIFLSGLLGNLSVCTVILKHPNMRTDTNVYLFSLAVSDILILIFGLAPELQLYWQMYPYIYGEFMCRFTGFLASTATWASALTVVALSIERYTAICHHTLSRTRGNRRVAIAIVAIWSISAAVAIPVFHVYHIVINKDLKYPPDSDTSPLSPYGQVCTKRDVAEYAYYNNFYWITGIVCYLVPIAILMLMYIKIALFIRTNRQLARESGIMNNCSENTKIFKGLVAVVLAFILCSAPFHYQRLTVDPEKQEQNRIVLVITALIYYFTPTINPLLYNAMSKRYRTAFKEIFTIGLRKKEYIEVNKIPESMKTSGNKSTPTTTITATNTTLGSGSL